MALSGLYVPLITPLTNTDQLDTDALAALAKAVLNAGAAGVVALGATGEPSTLTPEEARQIVDVCAGVCAERGGQLLVGAGSNGTTASVSMLEGIDCRANAALVVVPYYTRPSQGGVLQHFRQLAAASPVPLIIYNVPYRTGITLTADTLHRLAEVPNVIGFKHSVGAIDETTISFMSSVRTDVAVLAGDDLYAGPLMALGARGAIMASANLATHAYADHLKAWQDGPTDRARTLHNKLVPFTRALFAEPNPAVIKAVLTAHERIPSPHVRLPLVAASRTATATALECCPPSA